MKKLKIAAAIVIVLLTLVSFALSYEYYKTTLSQVFSNYYFSSGVLSFVLAFLLICREILILALALVFIISPKITLKDKAYRLLRFIYIMCFFFYLPFTIYYISGYFMPAALTNKLVFFGNQLCSLFCLVVLMIARPEKPVRRIDLSDYELVTYTSTGHRLVHYLLDLVFLLPFWLLMISFPVFSKLIDTYLFSRIGFVIFYLLYCLLSEAFFRQTFGKMLTNSCVVSNGIDLTFGRIFIRTLCRIIPFNAFSFLFRANWHDRVSSTAVVYVDTWEKVFEDQPGHTLPTV